jgi:hypothetical protein
MGTAAVLRRLSVEEYLDAEARSEVRREYVAGEVFAMVGAPLRHERLVRSVWRVVDAHLRDSGCETFSGRRLRKLHAVPQQHALRQRCHPRD